MSFIANRDNLSIGSLYKVPQLSLPFLFCDVIADTVHSYRPIIGDLRYTMTFLDANIYHYCLLHNTIHLVVLKHHTSILIVLDTYFHCGTFKKLDGITMIVSRFHCLSHMVGPAPIPN